MPEQLFGGGGKTGGLIGTDETLSDGADVGGFIGGGFIGGGFTGGDKPVHTTIAAF